MKTKNKKIIALLILIIIIILIPIIKYNNKDNNIKKITYNKNKSFIKEHNIEGITFTNIKCSYDGKDSLISYTITNKTDKDIDLKDYKVLVKDKKGTIITYIYVDFNKKLKPKEQKQYRNSVVGVDLSKAHSMELKLNNKK
ncbi:MAG: hypothetical protein VZS44_00005 [Bacilli bacterium]|nr:hypothetical protein [Bacilli bacterium]